MTDGRPAPGERVCHNCAHLRWLVALGLGLRCKHPANVTDGRELQVPSRRHTCPHFLPKNEPGPTPSSPAE